MSFVITRNDNEIVYGIKELLCDKKSDIETLATNYKPGSSVFCLEDSSLWILGLDKQWHEFCADSMGEGGGSGSGEINEYDYATKEDIDGIF